MPPDRQTLHVTSQLSSGIWQVLHLHVHYCDMKCALDMHVYSLVCILYWFMCVFMCVGILVRNNTVMCTCLSGFHVSSLLHFLHFWLCVFTHIVCIHHWVTSGVEILPCTNYLRCV